VSDRCIERKDERHFEKNRIALSIRLEDNWRMLAKVCSAAVNGIEAYPVEVEVNVGWGD